MWTVKKIMGNYLFKDYEKYGEWHEKGDIPNDPELEKKNEGRYREYMTIWKWFSEKTKADGKSVNVMRATSGGVRMSLEYLRMVLEDEMENYRPGDFRVTCNCRLDDYLIWLESTMAEEVFRIEQLVENDRLKKQYHIARRQIEKGMLAGDKKMLEMWLKTNSMFDGITKDSAGYRIETVGEYPEDPKFYEKFKQPIKEKITKIHVAS